MASLVMNRKVAAAVVLSGSLVVSGCQTAGEKETAGTIIGGVLGAVVGAQFGDGAGQLVATALGAGLGAYIGGQIGASLDEADRQKLAEATQASLVTGQTSSWVNPNTGVSGSVTVKNQETNRTSQEVKVLKDRVDQVPPLVLLGEVYQVDSSTNVNVRGGPSTDYKVVGSVSPGSTVDVIGKVDGSDWLMISENGAGSGFVFASLLQPTGKGVVPDENAAPVSGTQSVQVAVEQTCRTVEQQVVLENGETLIETIEACQKADGTWAVI